VSSEEIMHVWRTTAGVLHMTRVCSEARDVEGYSTTVTRGQFAGARRCGCLAGGFRKTGEQKRRRR
jgi:hypothetical protein